MKQKKSSKFSKQKKVKTFRNTKNSSQFSKQKTVQNFRNKKSSNFPSKTRNVRVRVRIFLKKAKQSDPPKNLDKEISYDF